MTRRKIIIVCLFLVLLGGVLLAHKTDISRLIDWVSYVRNHYDLVFGNLAQTVLSPLALRIEAAITLIVGIIVVFRTRNVYLGIVFYIWTLFFAYFGHFIRRLIW